MGSSRKDPVKEMLREAEAVSTVRETLDYIQKGGRCPVSRPASDRKTRKAVLDAVRRRNGITVEEMLKYAPLERHAGIRQAVTELENEGLISVDLRQRCTVPQETATGAPQYSAEVPYEVYLKYSDAVGQFGRTPSYAEVIDWLGTQGVTAVMYRTTQSWRAALRNSRNGVLVEDIRGDVTDSRNGWKTVADAVILRALDKIIRESAL